METAVAVSVGVDDEEEDGVVGETDESDDEGEVS